MKDLKMMFEGSEIKIIVNEKGEPLFVRLDKEEEIEYIKELMKK